MTKRDYYAARDKKYVKKNSPFLPVQDKDFSEKVPRKFLGHRDRYDYKLANLNTGNVDKIKSGCISHADDKKFKMQLFKYQKFVSAYVDPRTPYSCLVWHSVGSGKTMTMWHIIEGYVRRWHCKSDNKQIFVISNPKQLEGFENELNVFDKITGIKKYMTKFSRSLKYGDKNRKTRYGATIKWKRYSQSVQVILMNFVEASKYAKEIGFKNSVVILDEAHNVVNPRKSYSRYKKQFRYLSKHLSKCVSKRNVKVMPLTATPILEKVHEMGILLNMVSKTIKFPTSKTAFIQKYGNNLPQLKKDTRGLISYFNREADLSVQPRKELRGTTYGETLVHLSEHQIDSIIKSTKVLKTGQKQNENLLRVLATFSGTRKNNVKNNCEKLELHLEKFGPKILHIITKIFETQNEKHWIYCGLSKRAGTRPVSESLECKKWTRVKTDKVKTDGEILNKVLSTLSKGDSVDNLPGEDYKRFVVLDRDTPKKLSSLILKIINHHHNVAGKLVRVIIGDNTRKEGMDLYSIKNVHVLTPERKYNDWHQAISRAIRYCSFKYVPLVKDWNVNIFTYVSHIDKEYKDRLARMKCRKIYKDRMKYSMLNIDKLTVRLANKNATEILPYVKAFKESAIDCFINSGVHAYENITCDMKTPVVNKQKPSTTRTNTPKLNIQHKTNSQSNEKYWIVHFSRLSPLGLSPWLKKCKDGKCTQHQKNALKIVTSNNKNPFVGNGSDKSIHISDINPGINHKKKSSKINVNLSNKPKLS